MADEDWAVRQAALKALNALVIRKGVFGNLPQPRDKELLRTTVATLEERARAEPDRMVRAFLLTAGANGWIELGDFERGERCCRQAMALDRARVTRARYHLVRMGRQE